MQGGYLLIACSFVTGLVLAALPLPEAWSMARPAFVAALVSFWVLYQPGRFGIISAALVGLCLDAMSASLLGQHALALSLLAYLGFKLRDTLLMFPSWQQAIALLPVWGVYELTLFLIDGWAGHNIAPAWRWMPVLTTALIWPPMSLLIAQFGLQRRHA